MAEHRIADGFEPVARRAADADRAELVRLAHRSLDDLEAHRGGSAFLERDSRSRPTEDTITTDLDAMHEGRGIVLVGCLGEIVVGFGVALVESTRGSPLAVVSDLYVEPEARGVGVGSALMEHLIDDAAAAGCAAIESIALPGDRATKNFFEGFGLVARKITVHRTLDD